MCGRLYTIICWDVDVYHRTCLPGLLETFLKESHYGCYKGHSLLKIVIVVFELLLGSRY